MGRRKQVALLVIAALAFLSLVGASIYAVGYDNGYASGEMAGPGTELADGVFELILEDEVGGKDIYICLSPDHIDAPGEIRSIQGVFLGSVNGEEFLTEQQHPSPAKFEWWPALRMYCDYVDSYSEWLPYTIVTGIFLEDTWYWDAGKYIQVRDEAPLLPEKEGRVVSSRSIEFFVAPCARSYITGEYELEWYNTQRDPIRAFVWTPGTTAVYVWRAESVVVQKDNSVLVNFAEDLPSGAYVFLEACGYSLPTVGPIP